MATKTGKNTKTKKKAQTKKPASNPIDTQLPNVLQLTRATVETFWDHKSVFIGVTVVYGLLTAILGQGLANASTGSLGSVGSSLGVFVGLFGSAGGTTDQTAGVYRLILGLIASLAIIWALRQVRKGSVIRVRDAYYQGMTPLIPFVLVLLVASLQLLPMLIGAGVYNVLVGENIAISGLEKLLAVTFFVVLSLWSLYMLSATIFALYIVTLPKMAPVKALKSARKLVYKRRWLVLRKVLFLPVLLFVVAAVIMLPIIALITPLAKWVFFVLTVFSLLAVHSYLYNLYRELINE